MRSIEWALLGVLLPFVTWFQLVGGPMPATAIVAVVLVLIGGIVVAAGALGARAPGARRLAAPPTTSPDLPLGHVTLTLRDAPVGAAGPRAPAQPRFAH